MQRIHWIFAALLAALVLLSACAPAGQQEPPAHPEGQAGVANPASQYCIEQGGTLHIEKNRKGGEYGVCVFEENRQCEEWALYRGECPAGGVKVTGFATDAARFCGITGGEYTATGEKDGVEQGTCTLKGTTCDVWEYYDGDCIP